MTKTLGNLSTLVAAAVLAVAARPAFAGPLTGVVASAEVGGGVTNVDAHSGSLNSLSFGGVSSSVRLSAGSHTARVDFGLTGSALRTWGVGSSTAITFQQPDAFLMLSVGPFVGFRPSTRLPLTVGGRIELARGQMTGATAVAAAAFPAPGRSTDFFTPGNGLLGAAGVNYAIEGAHSAFTVGLEVTDGWLSGGGNTLHVLGAMTSAGYRWR